MPLTMANAGTLISISQVHAKDDTRRFLESLGFVSGATVMIVAEMAGNLIVNVKDTRVAISKAMANKIHVA